MPPAGLTVINGKVITPFRVLERGVVSVAGGKIVAVASVEEAEAHTPEGAAVIDADGLVVAPGFIDLHLHGGGGADVLDETEGALDVIARTHAAGGATGIVPSVLTCTPAALTGALERIAAAMARQAERGPRGAAILGAHLEGPYLSPDFKGAQDQRYLRTPRPEDYEALLAGAPAIVRVTAAPELPGALRLGEELKRRGILASMGHSAATHEQVLDAVAAGYSHVTHLYNAMSTVHRAGMLKVAGMVESALLLEALTVEIIADGRHLPAALLKLVYACKGPGRTALVTDALRPAGLPEGEYMLGSPTDGRRIVVEDGVAMLADRTALAGSVATMNVLVRNMVTLAGVPLADALRMASTTPAAIIGLDRVKGCLAPGMDADLTIFAERDFHVMMTIVGGRIVHDELTRAKT